jgi:hypothetical protein
VLQPCRPDWPPLTSGELAGAFAGASVFVLALHGHRGVCVCKWAGEIEDSPCPKLSKDGCGTHVRGQLPQMVADCCWRVGQEGGALRWRHDFYNSRNGEEVLGVAGGGSRGRGGWCGCHRGRGGGIPDRAAEALIWQQKLPPSRSSAAPCCRAVLEKMCNLHTQLVWVLALRGGLAQHPPRVRSQRHAWRNNPSNQIVTAASRRLQQHCATRSHWPERNSVSAECLGF